MHNFFIIVNAAFQIGNFLARSSLRFVKLPQLKTMSTLMCITFALLFWNAYSMTLTSIWVNSLLFFWVGLVGGAAYVNNLHQVLETKSLESSERELATTLALAIKDSGILIASIVSLAASKYIFHIEDQA